MTPFKKNSNSDCDRSVGKGSNYTRGADGESNSLVVPAGSGAVIGHFTCPALARSIASLKMQINLGAVRAA